MANRHLARSLALQTLFDWDFNNFDSEHIDDILAYVISEFGQGIDNVSFVTTLVKGVIEHKDAIDDIIVKSAPDWPLEAVARVDRNVLRIGLYELIYVDKREVPSRVAINEAIELAKTFGGKSSGRFINGVLGTVYKEAGQIDERFQEEEEREQARREVDPAKLPRESLAGSVVYRRDGDQIYFALVHDVFGHWTLSKGHLEENESEEDAARREIKEEIGVTITIKDRLGDNEYIASDPERGKLVKHVTYFLGETTDTKLKLKDTGGLDDVRWFKMEEISELKMYDDIRPIFTKAIKFLST